MSNVNRVFKIAAFIFPAAIILIYVFSKSINYSIIFSLGFIISISGYFVLIRMVDRCLKKGKGQALFFAAALLKMAVIAGGFYLASRVAKTAVLMYMLGLLAIVAAIMVEALFQFCRSVFKWKNTN
ncbi:MAG: hypothetical protein GY950_15265 [bacterium]|nr:hypothetical protein [bacterium]